MREKHFDEIDIIKGLSILFVLWHHSFILYPIYMLDIPWCQYAISIHRTFFLHSFFLVSGYLLACSRHNTFRKTIRKKFARLLIPYISFETITLGLKIVFPSFVNRKIESFNQYLYDLFFQGGELWFVYVLFLIFVIWSPVIKHLNRKAILSIVFLLMVLSVVIPQGLFGNIFRNIEVIYYSIFFLSGFLFRDIDRQILKRKKYFYISSVLFLIFCVILIRTISIPYIWHYVLAFIGCWFVWTLSFRLTKTKIVGDALIFCGKYSLSYYWLNGFALVLARTLMVNVLHIECSPVIVISIFFSCVILETLGVYLLRNIPYVRTMVGIT